MTIPLLPEKSISISINYLVTVQEFQNYTVARDTFLAHLGATLWGSMRHIISPSIADGAFHHYEKISFQLFFITEEVWCVLLNSNKFQL